MAQGCGGESSRGEQGRRACLVQCYFRGTGLGDPRRGLCPQKSGSGYTDSPGHRNCRGNRSQKTLIGAGVDGESPVVKSSAADSIQAWIASFLLYLELRLQLLGLEARQAGLHLVM